MATLAVTVTREGQWRVFTWDAATGAADTFAPVYLNDNVSDIFFEAAGTWDGSTVTLTGYVSDSTAAVALDDIEGTAVSMTADSAVALREAWPWFLPVTDAAGTTESIVVTMKAKVVK